MMLQKKPHPNREEMITQLLEVAAKLGSRHVPQWEFDRRAGVSHFRIRRAFGSYGGFLAAAGLDASPNRRVSHDELLRSVRNACVTAGGLIGRNEFRRRSEHTIELYKRRWGSWKNVLIALRDWAERHDPDFPHFAALPKPDDPKPVILVESVAPRYGAPMDFRGISNEPINEHGVVMVFGILARELGFSVERVASTFPDCEAKRCMVDGWTRVRIEFEFQSRNFERHGHDPAGCDLIVCWENNWPEAPIEVLDLKAEVEKRRNAAPRASSALS